MDVRQRSTAETGKRSADDAHIGAARRFNRFYTRQIGVLRRNFLGSSYSLAEARVLYEIARGEGATTASDIGRALDLDAGYLSRVLRTFEKRGLIRRTASPTRRAAKSPGAHRRAAGRLMRRLKDGRRTISAQCSASSRPRIRPG